MKTDTSTYIYIRDSFKNPVGCISYKREGDTVTYNLSVCADSDRKKFTKERARLIADSRLEEAPLVEITGVSDRSRGGIVRKIIESLASDFVKVPKRVKLFSKSWLMDHPRKTATESV